MKCKRYRKHTHKSYIYIQSYLLLLRHFQYKHSLHCLLLYCCSSTFTTYKVCMFVCFYWVYNNNTNKICVWRCRLDSKCTDMTMIKDPLSPTYMVQTFSNNKISNFNINSFFLVTVYQYIGVSISVPYDCFLNDQHHRAFHPKQF